MKQLSHFVKIDPCTLQQINVAHFLAKFVAPCNGLGIEGRRAGRPNDTYNCHSHHYYFFCLRGRFGEDSFLFKFSSCGLIHARIYI